MPTAIALTALKPLTYHGRVVAAGDAFAADPVDAAVLVYGRSATFAPIATTPEADTPVERMKRRYRRRNLTAEP